MKISYQVLIFALAVFVFSAIPNAQAAVGNSVGDEAPDFSLPNTENRIVTLSAHRGEEHIILIFYRGEW